MSKVTRVFRRIKNYTTGHKSLNKIVSDLKDVSTTGKSFMVAQETAMKDMAKWASKESNTAIFSAFTHFLQINKLWTEIQSDFLAELNKFKIQFDSVLEAEEILDKKKNRLVVTQRKEHKLTKELKKYAQKKTLDEVRELKKRVDDTRESIKTAKLEIAELLVENEAIKAVRIKKGLLNVSDGYINLGKKSLVVFDAQKKIVDMLPNTEEIQRQGIQNVQHRGYERAKLLVQRADDILKQYKRQSPYRPEAPSNNDSPPPYSSVTSANFCFSSPELQINYRPQYDLPPAELLDQDLLGAVGGIRVSSI